MSEGLKVLRDIGAQVIHNETHISREYVQAIIHETFDDLQSVQFVGFVSILEREYDVDLSDLRAKGKEFFKEKAEKLQEQEKVFVVSKTKPTHPLIYILLALGLFLSFAYYTFVYLDSMTPQIENLDNTKIDDARKNISPAVVEKIIIIEKKNEENATIDATAEKKTS
ncbi:MAG: hypothetical protein Q9M43_03910 [Sulfurimonas sp.]|nr:hypothetical protein [Sulfurimonas sp.]